MAIDMPMKNPPHPGELVRYDCLEPLGLSITDAAKALNVSRQALNNLVNGKSGISPEMAVRLSKVFNGSPEFWMRLQLNYDLAQIERNASKIVVHRLSKKQRKVAGTTRSAA
jgi:antitoxin HigA-1